MSSRLTKSFVNAPGRSVSTPCWDCFWLAPSTRRPPTSTVISGADRGQQVGPVDQPELRGQLATLAEVVAESVGGGLQVGERLHIGGVLGGVGTTRGVRHGDVEPGVPGGLSTAATPPSTTRSAKDTVVPEAFWSSSSVRTTWASSSGSLTSHPA